MTDSQSLINQIVDFYGQYLSCSREQLDLLALWTLHTHCCQLATFSPALNIHSRHKQSGKTLCLQLLEMLCSNTSFHTSSSPALIIRQTQGIDEDHSFNGTLLLDDCRFSTALQGVLSASFRWTGVQVVRNKTEEGDVVFDQHPTFFPKAFADNHRLPDCLRDISIPLALEPIHAILRGQPQDANSQCRRLDRNDAIAKAISLRESLDQWYQDHVKMLFKIKTYQPSQFPPELSCRQQDCAEPLLQIADHLIGGQWPQRARQALVNAFALAAFDDFFSSKQILTDVRQAFAINGKPQWISTADLLELLHTMDDRTWDEWSKGKPMNSKDLAALLAPFGIKSKNHRTGEGDKVAKGYNREDFLTSWQRHILPDMFHAANKEMQAKESYGFGKDTQGSHVSVAADLQNKPRTAVASGCGEGISGKETCGTGALACGEGIPGTTSSVAANSQNSSPSYPKPAAAPRSEPTAPIQKITTVIAGEQFSVEAAEYQKRRYSDPLREASMRAIEKALNQ